MAKLFLKVFYVQFLWILLLANLCMAFNMMEIIQGAYVDFHPSDWDWSTRYLGVSSMIDFFKNIDNLSDLGSFLHGLGNFYRDVFSYSNKLFTNITWPTFTQINNPVDWFVAVGGVFAGIGQMFASFFVWWFGLIVQVFYIICMLFQIVFLVILMMSGMYSNELPYDWYGIRSCFIAMKCLIV